MRKLLNLLNRKRKNVLSNCKHKWYHVQDDFIITGLSSIEADRSCHIYCPKCKRKDHVFKDEWLRIKKIQEIDEEFSNETNGY